VTVAITGQPGTAFYSLPKMMWWKETMQELYRSVWKFLCFGDYVLMRLGLDPVIDPSMAARTLAVDIHRDAWSETILDAAGIPVDCLPEVKPSGTLVGHLGAALAAELGLPPAVAVVTGGVDQACRALGVGVIDAGTGYYGLGTTEALALVVEPPFRNLEAHNVALCPHVAPGGMIAMAGSQTGGRLLSWYKDEFAAPEQALALATGRNVYDVILESLPSGPSPLILLPHFTGSGTIHNDPHSEGAILGMTFDTKRADVAKATMRGSPTSRPTALRGSTRKACRSSG
jgi:xylulokinase